MQAETPSVELNPLRTSLVVFALYIFLPGPSVKAIKLVSSNVSKDRCFQQYLGLEILLTELHTKSQVTYWGKIHC